MEIKKLFGLSVFILSAHVMAISDNNDSNVDVNTINYEGCYYDNEFYKEGEQRYMAQKYEKRCVNMAMDKPSYQWLSLDETVLFTEFKENMCSYCWGLVSHISKIDPHRNIEDIVDSEEYAFRTAIAVMSPYLIPILEFKERKDNRILSPEQAKYYFELITML